MLGTVLLRGWSLKSTKITATPAASSCFTASLSGLGPWPPLRAMIARSGCTARAFSTLKVSAEVPPTSGTLSAWGEDLVIGLVALHVEAAKVPLPTGETGERVLAFEQRQGIDHPAFTQEDVLDLLRHLDRGARPDR